MVGQGKRPLKVFLCHASGDKPAVRQLYKRLVVEGIDAWLDQEKLLPGQDWRLEIPKAVREADVVVICLSNRSITKEGYVQKEIKFALDIAEEKPEGTIFLIPARLEDCPVPERFNRWQWVDIFEENGYVRLLRSLKIRADKTGAVIEPTLYDDKELEKRIEQLYTEGLAAFWIEDWDKACHRFQTLLSERPNHTGAAEKLEEAELQRSFAKLYSKAVEAQKKQEWHLVISALEDLLKKASTYKDTEAMLKTARKEQQLKTLYAEAKTLHTAQKWTAVLKVFEQISSIEPNYVDPEGLLPSAQKEVAELERLAKLNDLYSNAIHKMDAGEWYEARTLLEQVHKSETGFFETEKLLRKVEDEINRQEEQLKRQDQINTLYEQANGLLRSKKWHKALDKVEEIRTLDEQFADPENIAEQAQKEIEREEQEAERQNELAAMYAEAVRLVREEKYQKALEKLQEVKSIDPRYPDQQKVQRTAKKSLAALAKPVTKKFGINVTKSFWIGLSGIVIVALVIISQNIFGKRDNSKSLVSSITTPEIFGETGVPSTLIKEEKIVFSSSRDSLGDQIFLMDPDGGNVEQITFDSGQTRRYPSISPNGDWIAFSSGELGSMNIFLIKPDGSELTILTDLPGDEFQPKWSPDGKTIIFSATLNGNAEIYSINVDGTIFTQLTDIESEDGAPSWSPDGTKIAFQSDRDGDFNIYTMNPDGSDVTRLTENPSSDLTPSWSPDSEKIAFRSSRDGNDEIYIMNKDGSELINLTNSSGNDYGPNWSPDGKDIVFFSDTEGLNEVYSINIASRIVKNLTNNPAGDGGPFWGFVVSDSETTNTLTPTTPTPYTSYYWDFDDGIQGWGINSNHISSLKSIDGVLTFDVKGNDPHIYSPDSLKISSSITPIITIRMRITNGPQSDEGQIYYMTDIDSEGGEDKKLVFDIKSGNGFQDYDIELPDSIVITQFRVDPGNTANTQVAIDYIWVHAP